MAILDALFNRSRTARNMARELENMRRFNDFQPFSWDWETRKDSYQRWQALYDNSIYEDQADGGFRQIILEELFGTEFCDAGVRIAPIYNPVKPIVDVYQNVLLGAYGREIKVAPEFDGVPVNPKLLDQRDSPIAKIWRWSNLDSEKQTFQRYSAGMGACGIRVVARGDAAIAKRRVHLQFDHPGRIKDFDLDDRGNVASVVLEYTVLAGPLGERRHDVAVTEELTRDRFVVTWNGEKVRDDPNPFGFCPYVINRHVSGDGEWGVPAFFGSEAPIHRINWLLSNLNQSVQDNIFATWFATASGPPPSVMDLGRNRVAYVKTEAGGVTPSLDPLVAEIDIGGAQKLAEFQIGLVDQRQPEMIVANLRVLANISGETVGKVLKLAEQAILRARDKYQSSLYRAMQMGMSEMIVMGLLDLGTGTGSLDAADRAYQIGAENFQFNDRPALPQSSNEQIQQAQAEQTPTQMKLANAKSAGGIVDEQEQLRIAGYMDDEIAQIMERKRTADVIPIEAP
jgi:hypothetical protein